MLREEMYTENIKVQKVYRMYIVFTYLFWLKPTKKTKKQKDYTLFRKISLLRNVSAD